MVYPGIPCAANMGWGLMAHGLMNMTWGTPANLNWAPPARSPMNANLGWAIPAQGNATVNLAWGAQTQANTNAGWVMPMQVNSAQKLGCTERWECKPKSWLGCANRRKCKSECHSGNTDAGTWTRKYGHFCNQNGGGGKTNSCGDGGSSHALPPAEQRGVCNFHENGHCKKRGIL